MRVEYKPAARSDVAEAARWYERRRPSAGSRFLASLEETISLVLSFPQIGSIPKRPKPGREVRKFKLREYPYLMHYEVTPQAIIVLSVIHGSRRGHPWRMRL